MLPVSFQLPLPSAAAAEEQDWESDDVTDSEESVYSGLEDSGSDSSTEEEEEDANDQCVEKKVKDASHSEKMRVSAKFQTPQHNAGVV